MKYLCLIALVCSVAFSQNTGALTGTIVDHAGKPVSGAMVIITNDATSATQQATTSSDGSFTVSGLPAGRYRVEVESNGRRRAGETVEILGQTPSQISMSFRTPAAEREAVDAASEPLQLEGRSPTLQTESAEVSRVYGTRVVTSLPLLDRQHQQLIGLMPGVTPPVTEQDRIIDPQRTRTFNVNGQPAFANAFHLNGTYQNEAFSGRPSRIISNEGVQALNIRTSNPNGEYGFSGGAWTNTVTRPGTNDVHGSLFAFHTNSFLTARNPLNTANNPDPRFNTNQFGGSLGGPVARNRMFLFGAYEGYLRRGSQLNLATVPNTNLRMGNFGGISNLTLYDPLSGSPSGTGRVPFMNNQIPQARIDPTAQLILGYLPQANQPGLFNNLAMNTPLIDDNHRLDLKMDHRFGNNWTGFARYGFTHGDVDRGSALGLIGDAASAALRNHTAVVSFTGNLSPDLTGDLRLGYTRYRNRISPWGDFNQLNAGLSQRGFTGGLPQIDITGFTSIGLPGNYPSRAVSEVFNPATNWTWHNGMHNLRFGADLREVRASGMDAGFFSPRGTFGFGPGATSLPTAFASPETMYANAFAGFLAGAPSQAGVSSFLETPTYRQTQISGYATDTINLWSQFYLELGIRYDVYSPVRTRRTGVAGMFNPISNELTYSDDNYNGQDWDLNNIAPRVGFAWRPGASRFVVRGGYALQYFPVPFTYSGVNQPVTGAQAGLAGGFTSVGLQPPTIGSPQGQAPNLPFYVSRMQTITPYIQSFSLMMQGDLGNGVLLDAGYVGTYGRQLPYITQLNAAQPGTGVAGLPFNRFASVLDVANGANNNYNSLQVNLTKRFAAGLAIAGAYTFSKALDTGLHAINPFDRMANYGPADWDRRHVLAMSHVWQLPFGPGSMYFTDGLAAHVLGNWELNGILQWATGGPMSIMADPLACACPGIGAIPANFTGSTSIDGSTSFNPALFSAPPAGSFGSLGRNRFRGPDLFVYNLAVFRNFSFTERAKFELRAEAYNLTNSTNYANPVSSLAAPAFGQTTQTFNGLAGRQFQLAGRLVF